MKLNEIEQKVLSFLACQENRKFQVIGYNIQKGIDQIWIGDALAKLKRKKLIAQDGRGNFAMFYATKEGVAYYDEHLKETTNA